MRGLAVLVLSTVAASLVGAGSSHAAPITTRAGEVLVRFERGIDRSDRTAALEELNVHGSEGLALPGLRLVEIGDIPVPRAVAELERQPGVLYAEPNFVNSWEMTPDDDYFASQWALENTGLGIDNPPVFGTPDADIDAAAAWDLSTGSDETVVGIADTGIFFNHPDLKGNRYTNPGESGAKASNGVDDDGNGYVDDYSGYDFFDADNNPAPSNPPATHDEHGTLVASTAGAQGNNSIGVTGVSQDVALMSLRVGDGPTGPVTSNQVLAYAYAGDLGAEVVNLSGGGAGFSQSVLDAIRAAPNTLFVFGAGNGGSDHIGDDNDLSPLYPCNLNEPNVVCVAATDQNDKLASFSNYGDNSVDLAAPGVNILAATIGTDPANSYDFVDGTSFSAPIVAGAAALYRSRYPQASAVDTRNALRAGVDKLASLKDKVETGGRLNLDRTLGIVPVDTTVDGKASAAKTQKQKGRKIVVKVKVKAGEDLDATASGKVTVKKKSYKLKKAAKSIAQDKSATLKLKPKKSKDNKKIAKALKKAKGKAKIDVILADGAGNSKKSKLSVTLKR
jgi:subtilisin family serine protease